MMEEQRSPQLLHDIFSAIAESYTTIVYMDTNDKSAHPIRLDDYSTRFEKILSSDIDMTEMMGMYVKDAVFKDDANELIRYADLEYVTERLKNENPILHIYRCFHNDRVFYFRLKIVPIEDGKKIIYGFENIDNEYRQQLQVKAEREMQMVCLKGLSREFLSVWYLDGKSRKIRLIQNNGKESENGEAVRIGNAMVDYHFSLQKYYSQFLSAEDFDRMMRETSYEAIVEKSNENELYPINYIRINPDGSKSWFQACYAKITDENGIANFVVGYRCIDGTVGE